MTPHPPSDSDRTATGLYAQANLAPGALLAGRFRIEALLGVGGMGVVYRATDLALEVPVALKLLRPELAHRNDAFERFRSELLLARQVSSPHVVRIHDLARHGQQWLISMDYIEGASLDKVLDRDGPLDVERALRIARQLAEGLAAAHAKGVVHRDLKPANVLLDQDDNAYISDFGVARSLGGSRLTHSGAVIGTPDYLSPEQARGDTVDGRSDLYALGLILYEMLSGKLPFAGGTSAEVLVQRMLRTPRPINEVRKDIPAWVARLIDKLLRPQPAHRFRGAAEVVAAIDRREVPRELFPDKRWGWGIAVALALTLGIGATWWQRSDDAGAAAPSPPLQRLLVLSLQAGRDATLATTRVLALDAHLRDALAAATGLAVVDAERTRQAVLQLDPTGSARPDIDVLHGVAAARQVLQPQLQAEGDGWRLRAVLHVDEAKPQALDGPVAASPGEALRAWLAQSATARALGLDVPPPAMLPGAVDALDAYGAALLARQQGKPAAALESLRTATRTAPAYLGAWLALSDTAHSIGETDMAAQALLNATQAAASAPAKLRERLSAASAILVDGDPDLAARRWQALLQAAPDDTYAQLQLARAQSESGDHAAASATAQALVRRDGNDPRAWFELGKSSILGGDARRAVDEYLVRALVLFKRSRNAYGEAETVNALGIGYDRLGQTADATEQFRKAVELRRALGNRRGEATSLRNLSGVLSLTGRFDEAAQHLEQARALYAGLGDRDGLATIESELGLLAEERGDYSGALAAYRRALQSWQQAGDDEGAAQTLNDIGFAEFQLGAYDEAQVFWQQAADAYEKLGSPAGLIRTAQNLGLLATARGQWSRAQTLLRDSLASAERQQMPEEAAVSRRNLAELALLQGRLGSAIDEAEAAETLFRQRQDQRGIVDCALLRAQALLAARADADAAQALDALAPLLDAAATGERARYHLLRAELASHAGNAAGFAEALRTAQQFAAESGVRVLQLRADLLAARNGEARASGLDAATAALGDAGLRLEWLELTMQDALRRNDPAAALVAWREAAGLLRNGDYRRAVHLQRLAAAAYTASGDTDNAREAQARADAAVAALRASLPAAMHDAFDRTMATMPARTMP